MATDVSNHKDYMNEFEVSECNCTDALCLLYQVAHQNILSITPIVTLQYFYYYYYYYQALVASGSVDFSNHKHRRFLLKVRT